MHFHVPTMVPFIEAIQIELKPIHMELSYMI